MLISANLDSMEYYEDIPFNIHLIILGTNIKTIMFLFQTEKYMSRAIHY